MSSIRSSSLRALLVVTILSSWIAASQVGVSRVSGGDFGVMVMAHGGSPAWNKAVLESVKPLQDEYLIEVAFGMADAASIQEAVQRLEAKGARKIAVVRLFISGESWYRRTKQILGVAPGAPARPSKQKHAHGGGHDHHGGHRMEFWKIDTKSSFALSTEGLAEAESMGKVLADRAKQLSRDPKQEAVLVLAHGPGDDSENQRWIANIEARAATVRQASPFRQVQVMTLREDWPKKREAATRNIRSFVSQAHKQGLTPIVIPFRVYGFGPYADVLDGLTYRADRRGLIPHAEVTNWIGNQIQSLRQAKFQSTAAK